MSARATRRELLAWSAAASSLALASCGARTARASSAMRRGLLIGPGAYGREESGAGDRYLLALLDLDHAAPEARTVELDFMGHGVAIDPTDPLRAAVFEKRGGGACELHLGTREVLRPIETSEDREFYGHGAFSPDGALLYATETVVQDDYRGVIVVRDGRTLAELGEFPSHGPSPHDCVLRDGGRTLVVTNGGGRREGSEPGSVSYVDVATERLIEKVPLASGRHGAGHLALTARGDLAVSSAAREWLPPDSPGSIGFRPLGGSFRAMTEPPEIARRMVGESLSVAVHEPTGTVGVTNPLGNVVTFWELESGRFLRALDLAWPRGIAVTLDESCFVVSFGRGTHVVRVDPGTQDVVPGSRLSGVGMTGSHVLVHDAPAT